MRAGAAVTLPGGLLVGEKLTREAAFRPFTGHLEEELAELVDSPGESRSSRATALLCAVLAHVGGEPATPDQVARLGFSDRQFLLFAFALHHRDDEQWRHVACARCAARFDVGFRLSNLPLAAASDGYPWAEATIGGRRLRLRLPTGEDEERIADLPPESARRALALGCVVSIDATPPSPAALAALGEAEVDAIDAALDAAAPQLATALDTACTECGAPQSVELDPYELAVPAPQALYREVHTLALRYHWSEEQILQMPRDRRRLYLDLIDQSHGAHH